MHLLGQPNLPNTLRAQADEPAVRGARAQGGEAGLRERVAGAEAQAGVGLYPIVTLQCSSTTSCQVVPIIFGGCFSKVTIGYNPRRAPLFGDEVLAAVDLLQRGVAPAAAAPRAANFKRTSSAKPRRGGRGGRPRGDLRTGDGRRRPPSAAM